MTATNKKSMTAAPVELIVNGQKVTGRAGQTILELVRERELDDIPSLCHDPRLEPFGSCFLCVVEVKRARTLLTACTTRITNGMEVVTNSDKIRKARKTALELLLSDHYADCLCPAQEACPAGVDVQGYLGLARLGYYAEALQLIKKTNPLPIVCGRVCVRRCEVNCRRNLVDEPMGINMVKRFVGECDGGHPELKTPSGKKVAVVGGGPAGLTCAYYLALDGHAVTIFEALPKLGGMLRYAIPEYRLPRAELDRDIDVILSMGVQAVCGKKLSADFTIESLRRDDGFDAVFLALGAPLGKEMRVPGEDAEGIEPALDFLRDTELHGPRKLHGKIVVVGGGNSAVDAARTARRSGTDEVTILYRRTRREMPAHHEEVDAAEKEGIKLEMLAAPTEIIKDDSGRLASVRCIRMELGEPDASGRRRPVPIEGSEFEYPCSFVFTAIGQATDPAVFGPEQESSCPAIGRWGNVEADMKTMASSIPGVFAGGDLVTGPAVVIDAIAHGHLAAATIDVYLKDGRISEPQHGFSSRREVFGEVDARWYAGVEKSSRHAMPDRDGLVRTRDFGEVDLGLSEKEVIDEASRCMRCGCNARFDCRLRHYATEYEVDLGSLAGQVRRHEVDDSHPLITLDPNKCILCGRCVRACTDVLGQSVLGFTARGFRTTIKPTMGKSLAESPCIACGACVETCPTGALTAKLPSGRQGPWKTERVSSACGFCSLACPLDLHAAADGLLWATSPEGSGPGEGDLCVKGRFGTGLVQVGERIRKPMIRKDGQLVECGWDEALCEAARLLSGCSKKHGPQSLAVLAAARMTFEDSYLVGKLAKDALGTDLIGSFNQVMHGGPRRDLDGILGHTSSTCFVEDIDDADLVVLLGADPDMNHPVLAMKLRRAARNGVRLAVINSNRTNMVGSAELWLNPRRTTAGILMADVLRRLIDGAQDLNGSKSEIEAFGKTLQQAMQKEDTGRCGVKPAKVDRLVEMLIGAKKIVAVYDLDEGAERSTGDLTLLAEMCILTGGGLLLLQADCNALGAYLAGMRQDPARDDLENAISSGKISGALVMLEDPLQDPEEHLAAEKLDALVVVDHRLTRTARAAQVVLPAATLAETSGTLVSFDHRLRKIERAATPPGGKTIGQLVVDLSRALGRPVHEAAVRAGKDGVWPGSPKISGPGGMGTWKVELSSKIIIPSSRSFVSMDELL
ncbi:MAG TPA: molybdopterin-dependent oxidoreductase [Myxococcota bacterium]|nr:molybdopterin-dependent oxidoreductase [Myxococcota bacterium]